jgi:hypothetical protein
VSRVALAATVADGDVDHHTGDGDGWRERGYREQQSVVGEDLDVGVVDHACTVGLGSTSLAVGSRLFSLPAPHESAPMRISVHASTTRQPNGPQDYGDLLDERSGPSKRARGDHERDRRHTDYLVERRAAALAALGDHRNRL